MILITTIELLIGDTSTTLNHRHCYSPWCPIWRSTIKHQQQSSTIDHPLKHCHEQQSLTNHRLCSIPIDYNLLNNQLSTKNRSISTSIPNLLTNFLPRNNHRPRASWGFPRAQLLGLDRCQPWVGLMAFSDWLVVGLMAGHPWWIAMVLWLVNWLVFF